MASFVVMESRPLRGEATHTVYVRDGFHFFGFLLPFVWLFWNRLWIEGALALAAALALAVLGSASSLGEMLAPVASLAIAVFVGLEGPALKVWALRRRGWRDWGVVEAETVKDAELRYLVERTERAEASPSPQFGTSPSVPRSAAPALGLMPYPGR